MEANKDEAKRCLELATGAFNAGNLVNAEKFLKKSQSMYPLEEAKALLKRMKPNASSSGSGSSRTSQHTREESVPRQRTGNGEGSNKPRTRMANPGGDKPSEPKLNVDYTQEQADIVKRVLKCKDLYELLGVSLNAPKLVIRKHYRKLALRLHPDKNKAPGSAEAFKMVSKAFATLSDDERRADYDSRGSSGGANPAPGGPAFSFTGPSPGPSNGHFTDDHFTGGFTYNESHGGRDDRQSNRRDHSRSSRRSPPPFGDPPPFGGPSPSSSGKHSARAKSSSPHNEASADLDDHEQKSRRRVRFSLPASSASSASSSSSRSSSLSSLPDSVWEELLRFQGSSDGSPDLSDSESSKSGASEPESSTESELCDNSTGSASESEELSYRFSFPSESDSSPVSYSFTLGPQFSDSDSDLDSWASSLRWL